MANAKVRRLRVLPTSAANLSFCVSGVVGELNVLLGNVVHPFDFASFYSVLGTTVNDPSGNPSGLKYNSQAIHDAPQVKLSNLLALRAETVKAQLDQAVGARQNTYYKKYSNQAALINMMTSNNGTKTVQLGVLSSALASQSSQLSHAYNTDARIGVVKATTSALSSTTTTSDTSTLSYTAGYIAQTTNDYGALNQTQTVTNTGYEYRTPYFEMQAQAARAQISLSDQTLAQWIAAQIIPNLATVFGNELSGVDLGVRQLQISYLNTILMSPIAGTVTAVRKNLGDYVKAGEPVVRVEDDTFVFLIGTLDYPGIVSANSNVTVTTTLPGGSNVRTLQGTVVASSGRRDDDEGWDVMMKCQNVLPPPTLSVPLPLHFSLDRDNTTIDIS
jgi:biotin carboxyl carrier protein